MASNSIRLLISCPDARGLIAEATTFVRDHGGNILEADQHTDPTQNRFFMRLEIDPGQFDLDQDAFARAWAPVATKFNMDWRLASGEQCKRLALLAGPQTHCVSDILYRVWSGEIDAEIACVISNHESAGDIASSLGCSFTHLPVAPGQEAEQERAVRGVLDESGVDVVVLARYMRVLSPEFVAAYPNRIINIHHSFLPAFVGAKPYHQAFERGVKLIGATSHYVTDSLDEGPIIAQQTAGVSHRDTIDDLIRKGRDLERVVLGEAVRLHVEDRVIVEGNKTVVFE